MSADPQADVIAFLSSPEAFNGAPVEVIKTHLSYVFLVGDRAFKIKRALKYDFADFSDVERRRRACEGEIAVNRRLAPAMYLVVVPIYRDRGKACWEAHGPAIEWAVEMKRFGADQQFDEMAARGELDDDLMSMLAEKLAQFHLRAERSLQGRSNAGRTIDQLADDLSKSCGNAHKDAVLDWAHHTGREFCYAAA